MSVKISIGIILLLAFFAVPAYAFGCSPGTSECFNETAYHMCGDTAIWDSPVNCPSRQTCTLGACEAPIGCKPGVRECVTYNTYRLCSNYALWGEETACQSGWSCTNGQCLPPTPVPQCSTPGQTRCAPDGSNIVQVCDGNLQWTTQRSCDYGCSNGYCKTCQPSSTRCSDGTHYQTCNSGGNWDGSNYCGANNVCQDGACIRDPSTNCQSVGAIRCSPTNSNMLQKCGSNYLWSDFQICQQGCFYNACRACSTGDRSCRDSDTYYMCNSQGQWGLATSCPTGYSCFLGSCQVPSGSQCAAIGQKRCSPTTPSMTQICGNNYVFMDYVKCGQGCSNGECMVCQPGTNYCADSSSYKSCDQNGQYTAAIPCASGQTCTGGKCVTTSVCTESARQCTGNIIQICKSGQWATYTSCPSDSPCFESQGTAYCKAVPAPTPTPVPTPTPAPEPQNKGFFDGIAGFFKAMFRL